jgi:hypothetical protein
MELLKPIIVKRWMSENKYIEYVFDINVNNKYKSDVIVIPEYIFQDNNTKGALNKIAYYIYNYEKKNNNILKFPYYCWDDKNNKPLLFDIKDIYWSGYNVNPFKSKDKNSKQLDEPIEYINNDNEELFNNDDINIVFNNDFEYDIKYYYNKNNKYNIDNIYKTIQDDDKLIELYNLNVTKVIEQNEYYNEVVFEYKMDIADTLIILFDKLKTDEEIQLIQFINNNNAIYKLYKNHTYEKKDLDYKFRLNSNKKDNKDISLINLYYKNKNAKLSIYKDGIFKLILKYDIDNGENKANILHIKDSIVKYLNKFNIFAKFKEIDVNARINYSIDNLEYQKLIKKIGTYTNIFEDFILNKKKCKGVFKYKRISGNSISFDLDTFIINRYYIEDNIIDEIFLVLKNMGIPTPINYIKGVINKKEEIDNKKLEKKNFDEKDETIIIIKEYNNNIDFYVDIKKASSFAILDNLKYWLIRIIESIRNERKPNAQKKLILKKPEPIPIQPVKKSSSKSSSKSKDKSDDIDFDLEEFNKNFNNNSSSGGAKNSINDNNYLINKLNNADKELYKDRGKGKNPARKCQKEYQPLVLKKDEIAALKAKGYDPYDKKIFDNYIEYGSSENNKNFYTCPRIWCPISNIPLDENNISGESLKCPGENEKPIMMNEIMKNKNKSRYVYLLKGDIEIPCCGKRNPEKKIVNTIEKQKKPKKINKKAAKEALIKDNKLVKSKELEDSEKDSKGDSKDNINENDKNYIMNKIPVPKNRFGGVQKELYYILFKNHKDYTKNCLSNNNINKNNCILRKGINNTDNIINSIAYLLGTNKEGFIEYVENNLDILKFLSLENGNVFKDFADTEPIIPEFNKELYIEFLNFIKKTNNKSLSVPDIDDITDKSQYQKSRLLYIYKSYKKFIKYLKAEDSVNYNIIHYLYTLVAILYNKLIVLWDVEIAHPNNDISIVCPRYSTISDLLLYLGKKAKVIMIMTTTENKAKDNETIYYEPIISKSLNKKEERYFNLDKHPNIKNILNKCSSGETNANEQFYDNIENMKTIKKFIIKKTGQNGVNGEFEIFRTVIINNDLSIDKIILKKKKTVLCIIKFKKISILMLNLIMKHLNIKDIVFGDDIYGNIKDVYIYKDVYSGIVKKFEKIDIEVDIGEIIHDNGITIRGQLLFKDERYTKNSGIISNILNKYNDFNKYSREQNKWNNMRKMVFDKLLESKYTDKYYSELLSKNSRKEIIKELLNIVKENKNYNSKDLRELQIIIESIDVYSRQSIKNWYSNNLSYEKFNYINDISNNIKEDGDELIFTQYLVSEKIPEKIIRDRDYLPNNYVKNTKIEFYEFNDNKNDSKSSDNNTIIPENWKGVEKVLTRKWTKYKKKVWSKLRYMECNYTDKNIIDLFGFFVKYNKNKINNIITFDDIIEYTYKEYYDIITDNSSDYKKEIGILFKDPHFKTIYINTMNSINKTNKTFKTTRIFLDDYLYKSSVAERINILNRIKKDETIKYYGDITLKQIATYLNINIIIIHHRVDYGKANDISKRAGSKDLKISMSFYSAGDNNNREELLKRPLIILYKKVDKSFISYYLIKNIEDNSIIYNELNNANEDIKNILNHPDSNNKSSTPITINI